MSCDCIMCVIEMSMRRELGLPANEQAVFHSVRAIRLDFSSVS